MAVERFSIVLDNVSGVFFAGQAVTGKVIVSIAEKWEKFGGKILLYLNTYINIYVLLGYSNAYCRT